jgi:hypothetical protein
MPSKQLHIQLLEYEKKVYSGLTDTRKSRGIVVAHERFELSSPGPKPDMLDHYTNGLHSHTKNVRFYLLLEVKRQYFA